MIGRLLKSGPDPDKLEVAQARLVNAQAQYDAAKKALSDIELIAPFCRANCPEQL